MTLLPAPTIDHVVVNVRDRMDEAVAIYRRLGFHMTPRGFHTLGSVNHLAIFGTDYLELIGVPSLDTRRGDILQFPIGLNGLVFATENADATFAQLKAAGVPIEPGRSFSRPVETGDGTRDAAFRTVGLTPGVVPAGRLYFCQHFNRDLVWREEWRRHPNGVVGVQGAAIASAAPAALGTLLAAMFGATAVHPIAGGVRLVVGLASIDVVTPDEVARRFGDAAPGGDGRADYMAALSLRTRGLAQASAALEAGGIESVRTPERIVVSAGRTMGLALEFLA